MHKSKYITLLLGGILLFSCVDNRDTEIRFGNAVDKIQKEKAPDHSLSVLDVELLRENNEWILRGETTLPSAREEIIALADSLLGNGAYKNELRILPDTSLGENTYGIVTVSVAHLRDTPSVAAQMIDQEIMGYVVRLLKKERGWFFVQTEYDYLGWMRGESFFRTDSAGSSRWKNARKVMVTDLYPMIYSKPSLSAEPVSDAVLNMLLKIEETHPEWYKISLPDGRTGYIRASAVSQEINAQQSRKELAGNIIKTARSMMGIPYLWGGNSSKSNDCSGFTQNVFRAHGITLPRDARQQVLVGLEVEYDESFATVLPGDLLFFGREDRITHVGISLGGSGFIHQSGMVQINSLDSTAANFSSYRLNGLQKIKRIF
ncbi:MAG: hypothetical protein EH225_08880 [Calditrichaeota bacterium]|nr:C40 family peptidase [Calditrichota bacterium]RQW02191.1 MAG: hypothetical protein EH225_08880 [Calditrichota bacterium]